MKGIFVTGNGTTVGKTVASAVLVRALNADYWKPLQSGNLDTLDSEAARRLSGAAPNRFHPARYLLTQPLSPHAAAQIDGVRVELDAFVTPRTNRLLVVEGAGGLLVPLNDEHLVVDLIRKVNFPVVVVARHYLGSINHTLLTIEVLQRRSIPILGALFVGNENVATESSICLFGGVQSLGRLEEVEDVTPAVVDQWAERIRQCDELMRVRCA